MSILDSVRTRIQQFSRETKPVLEELSQQAHKLATACEKVGRSWSRSFAGYHGSLYYGRFEPPPMGHFFSPVWGGTRGIPDGWKERSAEEVKAEIERLAGMSIDELEKLNAQTRERANDVRADVLDQLEQYLHSLDRTEITVYWPT
jgi:cell division septum initiation protein DivIVA